MIIAVDGPAAAGKGTLARRLAAALDYAYMDTGLIYRAVAAKAASAPIAPTDRAKSLEAAAVEAAESMSYKDLNRDDLRTEEVGQAASVVAAMPAVRAALLVFQRRFAEAPPDGKTGAVLDGRDIGTAICPDAQVKFFVTASPEARARRRHKELIERGEASIYARVLQEMQTRDARDQERAVAPLKPAEDAVVFETSEMDADAVFQAAMDIIASRRSADRA